MSPILGITASANQGQFISYGAYESIATVTVGSGGSSSITFSSIPATYTHLQIRYFSRLVTGSITVLNYTVNSITSSSYSIHRISGNGTAASAYGIASQTQSEDTLLSTGVTSTFSGGVIDILDYANTNKYKTIRSLTGVDLNGSGQIILGSCLVQTSTAVNSITFGAAAGNFAQYTSFALYGIK